MPVRDRRTAVEAIRPCSESQRFCSIARANSRADMCGAGPPYPSPAVYKAPRFAEFCRKSRSWRVDYHGQTHGTMIAHVLSNPCACNSFDPATRSPVR